MGKYQAYPEYKDSGIDWIGDIPEHWIVAELKRYAWVQGGYAFSSDSFVDSGIPVIRIGDIKQDGTISLESCKYIKDAVSIQYRNFEVHSGDLLMAMTGATIGKAGWFKGSQRALLNQRVGSFKCNKSFLNYKFFWYVLNSLGYQEHIRITAFGGAQPNISDTGMVSYQSAIPDLIEQENIANFLDHETAKIDTLIDKQQQLIQLLKEKRQAVISHAVTKGLNPNAPMRDSGVEWLGEVPEHWEVAKVKYVAELTPKKSQITQTKEQTCSFVPMEKLKKDSLILDETRKISDVYDGYTFFEDEDVLLAKVTPCFENQNMVVARGLHNGIGFGSSEIFVLRCRIKNLNDFLYYRLQEEVFMTVATGEMTGAGGLKRVPSDFINNYPLALPLENERLEIVSYIQEKTLVFDRLIKQSEGAIELMQERRTALISAAVTGKIDVRHPVCHPTGDLQSSKSTVHGDL